MYAMNAAIQTNKTANLIKTEPIFIISGSGSWQYPLLKESMIQAVMKLVDWGKTQRKTKWKLNILWRMKNTQKTKFAAERNRVEGDSQKANKPSLLEQSESVKKIELMYIEGESFR